MTASAAQIRWSGAAVASVCRAATDGLSPGHEAALGVIFGREPGEAPPSSVAVIGPGSPAVLRMAAIGWAFLAGERVLWSAPDPAADFRGLLDAAEDSPVLRPQVLAVHRSHGRQRIEALSGGGISFGTRRSFRGLRATRLVVTGADSLTWREARGLWPVLAGQEGTQALYGAADLTGDVLAHVRDAVAAGNAGVAIAEVP